MSRVIQFLSAAAAGSIIPNLKNHMNMITGTITEE